MTRCKTYKNGRAVFFSKLPNGWYETYVRNASGDIYDRVRCDTYRHAMEYYKCFWMTARAV